MPQDEYFLQAGRLNAYDDQTLTAALLDRLLHHAHIVQISGNSYRLKGKKTAGILPVICKEETQ